MLIFCVRCKSKTETKNPTNSTSKNGRNMIKGTCSKCGTKKCQFVSK